MNLIECEHNLLKSDPLEPFETDCTHCKNFISLKFSDCGKCRANPEVFCGWGCTCKKMKINNINEFIGKMGNITD